MIKSISKIFLVSLIGVLVFTSLPQQSAVAQSVDDETLIHQTIDAYFNLTYEARTDLNPKAFGQLVATNAQAQRFLNKEMDRRDVEYHRGKLFKLAYAYYDYTLDYQSIEIDVAAGNATVKLIEGNDVVYEAIAPQISSMSNLEHTITLIKVKGEWKIVEDLYEDQLMRQINSGMTKAQLIALSNSNYQETQAWQQANSTAKPLPQRPMSGNPYNRTNAVNYANANWNDQDGNADYKNLDGPDLGDCTNFVSQALKAGGIGETAQNGDHTGWWYEQGSDPANYAYPWAGAHLLWQFVQQTWWTGGPEATIYDQYANPYSVMSVGDVIAYDLSAEDGWWFDHVAIVNYKWYGSPPWQLNVDSHNQYLYNTPYTYWSPWRNIHYIHITGW